jgi:hypothetical protein
MSASVLHKVAYFHLCECQEHGFLVLADGRRGPECASKNTALEDVRRAIRAQLLSPVEAELIRESLKKATHLPPVDVFASPDTLLGCLVRSKEILERTRPEESLHGFVPAKKEDFEKDKNEHYHDYHEGERTLH